jgi:hypothetical protein
MTCGSCIVEKMSTFLMKQSISRQGALCTSMAIGIKWCPSWSPLYLWILVMVLSFITTFAGQLMTFEATFFRIESISTTSTMETWSSRVMYISTHNETIDVRVYHHSLHIMCPFFRMKAYMTFRMASCVVIYWLSNRQWAKCVPNVSNPCPHSHVRRLDAKGWIKSKQKCNFKVKVECAMENEQIDDLTTNHNPAPLPEQEWMQALDVKKMESPLKIDLRDVSWCMSIKDACRLGVLIMTRLSK